MTPSSGSQLTNQEQEDVVFSLARALQSTSQPMIFYYAVQEIPRLMESRPDLNVVSEMMHVIMWEQIHRGGQISELSLPLFLRPRHISCTEGECYIRVNVVPPRAYPWWFNRACLLRMQNLNLGTANMTLVYYPSCKFGGETFSSWYLGKTMIVLGIRFFEGLTEDFCKRVFNLPGLNPAIRKE